MFLPGSTDLIIIMIEINTLVLVNLRTPYTFPVKFIVLLTRYSITSSCPRFDGVSEIVTGLRCDMIGFGGLSLAVEA